MGFARSTFLYGGTRGFTGVSDYDLSEITGIKQFFVLALNNILQW
jgi:hypothetical protein